LPSRQGEPFNLVTSSDHAHTTVVLRRLSWDARSPTASTLRKRMRWSIASTGEILDVWIPWIPRRDLGCLDSPSRSWMSGFPGFPGEILDVWNPRRDLGCLDSSGFPRRDLGCLDSRRDLGCLDSWMSGFLAVTGNCFSSPRRSQKSSMVISNVLTNSLGLGTHFIN
jgi:hypothetical protein